MAGDPRFPPLSQQQQQPQQSAGLVPYDAPQTLIKLRGDITGRGGVFPSGSGGSIYTSANAPPINGVPVNVTWVASAHQYAWITTEQFAVGLTSIQTILEPVNFRNFLAIRNASASATGDIYIDFGRAASVANSWLRLQQNEMVLFDAVVPQNDVYVIADEADCSVVIAYSNIALQVA
jgi:hypothetical protein